MPERLRRSLAGAGFETGPSGMEGASCDADPTCVDQGRNADLCWIFAGLASASTAASPQMFWNHAATSRTELG